MNQNSVQEISYLKLKTVHLLLSMSVNLNQYCLAVGDFSNPTLQQNLFSKWTHLKSTVVILDL